MKPGLTQSGRTGLVALAILGIADIATGQTPVSDARVAELLAQAQAQVAQPSAPTGPVMRLSIDDAVKRGLERNLDLNVERLNPQLVDLQIAGVLASYQPTLTSLFSNTSAVRLPTSQLQGIGTSIEANTQRWNSGLAQNVRWTGGSYSVTFSNSRDTTTDGSALRNPAYASTISGQYTQPLLRGFRIDSTRTSLLTTRISRETADINLRATIVNTEASIRNAYWDLVYAVQAVEAARRSLDLATRLVEDNRLRVEVGTMAPIDVVQAEAEQATRRQALVQAEANRRTAELAFKRLVVGGTEDELWRATIEPTDRPPLVIEPIDVEAALRSALENRTDLATARKTLESNDISMRNLSNQALPALDIVTNLSLLGRGGTELVRASGFGGTVQRTIPGSYWDVFRNIRRFDAPTWSVQVNLSYPIGRSAADANLARARLQLQQTQAQIKQIELQIATDIASAALAVRNSQEAVQAAQASRELAERRLEAEQSKFDVGMSTNYLVVQAQRDLADAQNSELRALLNYRKALVDFQRVQITGGTRSVTAISGGGGGTGGGATAGGGATGGGGGGTGGTGGGATGGRTGGS